MTTTEATVKERPILFSGPMVRAIIEGRKTQTRRIVKPQPVPTKDLCHDEECHDCGDQCFVEDGRVRKDRHFGSSVVPCPYGAPGERLWVRETRYVNGRYAATDEPLYPNEGKVPSIFMPRYACRLILEITGVRVERLNEISEDDAQAEGVERPILKEGPIVEVFGMTFPSHPYTGDYVDSFHRLWDKINGKAHPWESNPWVWVVEFRPLERWEV
jgi:hypothetical protein